MYASSCAIFHFRCFKFSLTLLSIKRIKFLFDKCKFIPFQFTLTLVHCQLILPHWLLLLEQLQVPPEHGKSKFLKLHAAIQQGKGAKLQYS